MIEKFFGNIIAGSKEVSIPVLLRLTSNSQEALGKLAADVNFSYWRQGQDVVNFPLTDLSSLVIQWTAGGWVERGFGVYRLDVPDESVEDKADWVEFAVQSTGCFVFHERYNLKTELVGGVSSGSLDSGIIDNIYVSLVGADNYFLTRLNTTTWDDEIIVNKLKALKQATRIIDRLQFSGTKTDPTQLLEFPRNGDLVVPDDIMIACAEIGINLLDGRDPDSELENLYSQANAYSSVRNQSVNWGVASHVRHGVPSATAWSYLLPYLLDPRVINLARVS